MTDVSHTDSRGMIARGFPHTAARASRPVTQGGAASRALLSSRKLTYLSFSLIALSVDLAAILGASVFADFSYTYVKYGLTDVNSANVQLGFFAAILFVAANLMSRTYTVANFLDLSGHVQRTIAQWTLSFLAAVTFGFLAKAIDDSSRGAFLVFCLFGAVLLFSGRALLTLFARRHACHNGVLASRVYLVGLKHDIDRFIAQNRMIEHGMTVVGITRLQGPKHRMAGEIAAATENARGLMPDDIYLVLPWKRMDIIDLSIKAFMRVPSALHLTMDATSSLSRIAGTQTTTKGSISSLRLDGYSMSPLGLIFKRIFDIVASALALVVLSPVLLAVAIAIKLDSRGPVLFTQTRHGFNKVPFRIIKFRSMTTMEDGGAVRQVTQGDARITPIGRILRRYNIDELPQLINVFRGEMSLVGPRPHALVHDSEFETNVELYARRHNVKPGITGWAQVNGYRGETDTQEKISKRVQYDLHYVDHWSFFFDIWILFLTVFSRRAYRNAA